MSDPGNVTAGTTHDGSTARAVISSYVPVAVQRLVNEVDGHLTEPRLDQISGALLFADISGFTAMTERLAEKGPAGVELLTRTLNDYFGSLIEVITAHGGDVLKFAGDALVVSFPEGRSGSDEARRHAVLRASACALEAQQTLAGYTSDEGVPLSLKIAVSAGQLVCAYLGGIWGRWEQVVFGRPLSDAGKAADFCERGAVVLSGYAWGLVEASCKGELLGEGVVRIDAVDSPPDPVALVQPELTEAAAKAAWTLLPGAIRVKLLEGHGHWMAELRKLTVIFAKLPGHAGDVGLGRSQELMVSLQRLIYRVEGSVNKISVDDKGLSLIAVLGMPPLAHEDDARRGVLLALEMRELMMEMEVPCSIGVTTGRAFCGVVGSDRRCEYTMLGDIVNLSARLMVASQGHEGHVLCDKATRDAAEAHFDFEAIEALKLKGKSKPIPAFCPSRRAVRRTRHDNPLAGRVSERRALWDALKHLEAGRSSMVIIEAEAGVGKSRLLEEIREMARQKQGVRIFDCDADAIEKKTAYIAWRQLVTDLFGIEEGMDLEARANAVKARLTPLGDLAALAPTLEIIVPLGLGESDATQGLEPEARAAAVRDTLVGALSVEASISGLVLLVEDTQWMDSMSWALLAAVVRSVSPLLVVIATRPVSEAEQTLEFKEFSRLSTTVLMRLERLTPEHTRDLICGCLGVDEVPEDLADFIAKRTEGNAFFTQQLALALRDSGVLQIEAGRCALEEGVALSEVGLPDTVEGVVTQRIDRLDPTVQLTLKVASVVGRVFGVSVVNDVFPLEELRGRLGSHLDALTRRGLTRPEEQEVDPSYLFRHIITREVAYNLMLFSQRRELHLAVAQWFEDNFEDLTPHYPLLAHHLMQGEDLVRAQHYLLKAGDQAMAKYASEEAISFYTQAAEIDAARPEGPDKAIQSHCAIQIGHAHWGHARSMEKAEQALRQGLATTRGTVPRSRLGRGLALFKEFVVQALRRRFPARFRSIAPEAEHEELRVLAKAHNTLCKIRYLNNDTLDVIYSALRSLNLAERAGPSIELTESLSNMTVVAGAAGMQEAALDYEARAMDMLPLIEDPGKRAEILQGLGIFRGSCCGWGRASELFGEMLVCAERVSNPRLLQGALQAISRVNIRWGRFEVAADSYERLLELGRANNNDQATLWALGALLQMQHAPHDTMRAERIDAVRAILKASESSGSLVDIDHAQARGRMAWALWQIGRFEEAEEEAKTATDMLLGAGTVALGAVDPLIWAAEVHIAQWKRLGDNDGIQGKRLSLLSASLDRYGKKYRFCLPIVRRIRGELRWLTAREAKAMSDWTEGLAAAEDCDMPYEAARCHHALAEHLPPSDPRRQTHLDQARHLYERMGTAFDLARLNALESPALAPPRAE